MYFEHGIHIQKLYLESAEQQGVLGYIARSVINAILSGEQTDLSDAVFVYELTPGEGDKTTGGGLAWGSGCSLSLTPELVMFTDNADPVKLLAHGFNVDQSIRAGRPWNKKASKTQASNSIGKTRGGLNTKIHAIVGKDLRPVAFLLSAGNVDDCTEAVPLLKLLPGLKDCDILADKAYGTKEIRTYLHDQSARYTIPPKVNTWICVAID